MRVGIGSFAYRFEEAGMKVVGKEVEVAAHCPYVSEDLAMVLLSEVQAFAFSQPSFKPRSVFGCPGSEGAAFIGPEGDRYAFKGSLACGLSARLARALGLPQFLHAKETPTVEVDVLRRSGMASLAVGQTRAPGDSHQRLPKLSGRAAGALWESHRLSPASLAQE